MKKETFTIDWSEGSVCMQGQDGFKITPKWPGQTVSQSKNQCIAEFLYRLMNTIDHELGEGTMLVIDVRLIEKGAQEQPTDLEEHTI